MTGSGC
jgi:hypothetical protein